MDAPHWADSSNLVRRPKILSIPERSAEGMGAPWLGRRPEPVGYAKTFTITRQLTGARTLLGVALEQRDQIVQAVETTMDAPCSGRRFAPLEIVKQHFRRSQAAGFESDHRDDFDQRAGDFSSPPTAANTANCGISLPILDHVAA